MMIEIKDAAVLFKPKLHSFERDGIRFFLDGEAPNWIATDARGARLIERVDGRAAFGDIARHYGEESRQGAGKAWRESHFFLREALERGILALEPIERRPYRGRAELLVPTGLNEFWLHLVQTCNLSCSHCLVSSGPAGEKGPETAFHLAMIDQAHELGARRFYFTGGEPFVRDDIFELIDYVAKEKGCELIVMTNATLFEGARRERLERLARDKVRFQVSLDGATLAVNDAIRGPGVFEKASRGLKTLTELGFQATLTAAVTKANLEDLRNLPRLAAGLGSSSVHLMWLHQRGRVLETAPEAFPSAPELITLARRTRRASAAAGVSFDNWESLKSRANGWPGVKHDLGNQCWDSLCVYVDGRVYPSAAMAGVGELSLGSARERSLRSLWLDSPVAKSFRKASVAQESGKERPFRFLTGGGDVEHAYFFKSRDPYIEVYEELIQDVMVELAKEKRAALNARSGFDAPVVYHAMGDGAVPCGETADSPVAPSIVGTAGLPPRQADSPVAPSIVGLSPGAPAGLPPRQGEVRLLHSNCALSFDVEKPRRLVQRFYARAADQPRKELCCPVRYAEDEIGHIPSEVTQRFYGCGSPVSEARVGLGETVLDLGSGAGIDCFIAAKKVGPRGNVIGVDMTAGMLRVARECQRLVARKLGYDVVEFREGYLERIPVADKSADLVTSNCVINLSPDKPKVFAEIWRVLKDGGRFVVADIVSERPVPAALQAHEELWGECISGALSEGRFLAELERAGFYGISILKKSFWKEVEGHRFHSLTVRGFKSERISDRRLVGHQAVYLGPLKAAIDEEGHLFPRGEAVEVGAGTAAKLMAAPYVGDFQVIGPPSTLLAEISGESSCCAPDAKESCC